MTKDNQNYKAKMVDKANMNADAYKHELHEPTDTETKSETGDINYKKSNINLCCFDNLPHSMLIFLKSHAFGMYRPHRHVRMDGDVIVDRLFAN